MAGRRGNVGQAAGLALVLLAGAAGCGTRLYPVTGKVTYPDGQPLTEGTVVFESQAAGPDQKLVMARGPIQADGSYALGTYKPGDGAPAGKYRALVAPKYDANAVDTPSREPAPVAARYTRFDTSGLQFEVTAAGPNQFPIQ